MSEHVNQAKSWVSYAESNSGEAQAGGEYMQVCTGVAQVHATLAVAEAIEDLARAIVENLGRP